MKSGKRGSGGEVPAGGSIPNRILGSLRDALAAASRESTGEAVADDERTELLPRDPSASGEQTLSRPVAAETTAKTATAAPTGRSAAEALRDAKTPSRRQEPPTAPAGHGKPREAAPADAGDTARTQIVRGKPKVAHGEFHQDPVVGWLVVVGGPGLGAFRPIYEGNNSIGRGPRQRIPIDFGDNMISSEEQAFIRYDSMDRTFLLVPNLAKTNVVAVNNKRPTGAVKLEAMDMITMGRTQLAFVPFCGEEFDWSELAEIEQ
jgi:hypothetical protein